MSHNDKSTYGGVFVMMAIAALAVVLFAVLSIVNAVFKGILS